MNSVLGNVIATVSISIYVFGKVLLICCPDYENKAVLQEQLSLPLLQQSCQTAATAPTYRSQEEL